MISNLRERLLRPSLALLAAALAVLLPQAAHAQAWAVRASPLRAESAARAGELRSFYAARQNRPLWFDETGELSPAADQLVDDLRTAEFDGLSAAKLRPDRLAKLLDKARRGDEDNAAEAELELTRTFALYVRAMRG